MRVREWIRASQAILFEASIVPASVGTAAAVHGGARFDPIWFATILVSLAGIQAGANLFKGYFEGRDRSSAPASAGSWFAFDSSATTELTANPRTILWIGRACFALGAGAGLLLVILTRNVLLLAFGVVGAVLAWSYSSPPLRLSYRGIGEFSTFLAFGPVMTVGATVAFGGWGLRESLFASVVLGLLAAAISFARYFPNRVEDASKGKRTPVTILGFAAAKRLFLGLLIAPLLVGAAWIAVGGGFLWMLVLAAFICLIGREFAHNEVASHFERAIAWTVAAHALVGVAMIVGFAAGL